jgi:RHS repeat-associated protein
VQRTQYYPSGLTWKSNSGDNPGEQPYKYGGKEFVEMHGLDEYDSDARWYYPAIMRTTTMDPLAEKYYDISPYTWCGNNPVSYIDPTGMYIEEGSQKEWERRKDDVTSQRDYLQKRVDKLTAKAEAKGWSAEKLASRIGDKTERITSLNTSLGTMRTLESSSQGYSLSHTAPGENGGVTLNTGTNTIDIRFGSGNTANFVHEVTHAGQFETGDIAFDSKSGNRSRCIR